MEKLPENCINSATLLGIFLEDDSPPVLIAATSAELSEQLILRSGPIPLGSRHTWISIQKSDEECRVVFKMKSLGEAPRRKNTNPTVNKIYKEAIDITTTDTNVGSGACCT